MSLLSKWEPLREIEDLMSRSWPWPAGRGSSLVSVSDWNPRVDISEADDHYEIQADIPGVAKDDLKVTVDNGVVTLQGERRQEKEEDTKRLHRVERFYGGFMRSFTLPQDADPSVLKASARDGQLTVTIPKQVGTPSVTAVQVPLE
jgi:HSP20 family protein